MYCIVTSVRQSIVLAPDGAPSLVSFGLARSLAEIRPEFSHHSQIVGTLAYLAPEQTGRTGRPVDQRADSVCAGRHTVRVGHRRAAVWLGGSIASHPRSFGAGARAAEKINAAVPGMLSAIILHLLEKNPTTAISRPTAWSMTCSSCANTVSRRRLRRGSAGGIFRRGPGRRRG